MRITGALNITQDAWRRSRAAQSKVDTADNTLRESERERRRTEGLMEQAQSAFNRTFTDNENALDEVAEKIADLEAQIPDINQNVGTCFLKRRCNNRKIIRIEVIEHCWCLCDRFVMVEEILATPFVEELVVGNVED